MSELAPRADVPEGEATDHVEEGPVGTEGSSVRVLLVDDHEVVRQGLRLLLETVLGYEVVEASDAMHAMSMLEDRDVDVVLLDARMPERDGIWALQRIGEEHPGLPVIMLSTYDTEEYVDGAIEHGAAGYLLKDASAQQLREAVETAIDGRGLYLHPQVAQRMLARRRDPEGVLALSEREREILALLATGLSNEEIAQRLYLAEKTVKSHLTSVFRKLRVANRTQAVAKALREGLIEDAARGPR